jgi:hypothetical protein
MDIFFNFSVLKVKNMKRLIVGLVIGISLLACQENEGIKSEYTGNEMVYPLQQGSAYAIDGTVTFKEKSDGTASILVSLSGTEGNSEHPVHLHFGDITKPGADVAALLNPVLGKTGTSETNLLRLSDETSITYNQLIDLEASIKIHLAASGPDRDIILAGGNIGVAASRGITTGRSGIGICNSK